MVILNLYGVLSDHVEFASSGYPGLLTMSLDMWHELDKPFSITVEVLSWQDRV